MTHKQKAIEYCKEYLREQNQEHIYDQNTFSEFYRTTTAKLKNAYAVALEAADFFLSAGIISRKKAVKKFTLHAITVNVTLPSLVIHTSQNAYEVCAEVHQLEGNNFQEFFYVLFLNQSNKVTGYYLASMGGVTGTVADPRLIIKAAALSDCVSIVLCHNHPSGSIKPSQADIDISKKIKEAAKFFDIKVLDHIIYAESQYFSFADDGLI